MGAQLWNRDAIPYRVYLKQIRSKLEPVPSQPRYFLTHRGLGVRFSNEVGRGGSVTTPKPVASHRTSSSLPLAPGPNRDNFAPTRPRDLDFVTSR